MRLLTLLPIFVSLWAAATGHAQSETIFDATQNLLFTNALRWVVSTSPKGNPFLPQ